MFDDLEGNLSDQIDPIPSAPSENEYEEEIDPTPPPPPPPRFFLFVWTFDNAKTFLF